MGLDGQAMVVSVEPRPPIADGPGRVILATVTSLARDPLELGIEGEGEPLRLTTTHRLFSETRGDWVPAGELAVGDQVRTAQGPRRVESVQPLSGAQRVYNLEVQTRHCYHVGQAGVLSHSGCSSPSESPVWNNARRWRGQTRSNGKTGRKARYYEWDYTHNNIEVYDGRGRHIGVADPISGKIIRPARPGHKIKL